MNFLTGVKRLRQEAGVAGTGPTTVLGQAGELQKLISWYQSAYEDIQNLHPDWLFLRQDFSVAFPAATATRDYADASITSFASWKKGSFRCYKTATGVADEQMLPYLDWTAFRDFYVFGGQRTQTGRPQYITIKPDNTLLVYPIPDEEYTVVGEYFMAPQELAADADTLVIPDRFQMAVVWRALMFFAAHNAEPDKYANGEREYNILLRKMEADQLPAITWGAPLA